MPLRAHEEAGRMQGRALGPVVLRPVAAVGVVARDLLSRPDVPRRTLHVGVLVADPADRPGRGSRLLGGMQLGLDQARDLDVVVTAAGATAYGPVLLDAASRLLDGGIDVLVVTTTGVARLVAPLCAARGVGLVVADEGDRVELPAQHRPGVLRHTEQHWQEAYVLGEWAGRHLDGSLFQLVTRDEEPGDGVLALRAGFVEAGGSVAGSVEVWPKSASAAALVARVSGARVIAVHATGHQLHEIVRALRAARVPAEIVVAGRGVDERTLAELGRGGPLYAASAWHRADVPDLAVILERGTGERADAVTALGYDVAGALVDACRREVLPDLGTTPADRGLVVRRAAGGRTIVVARREVPAEVPDLDAVAAVPAIAALPHHG
jgi:hypothetical protein